MSFILFLFIRGSDQETLKKKKKVFLKKIKWMVFLDQFSAEHLYWEEISEDIKINLYADSSIELK